MNITIGYDQRESIAAEVCKYSIELNSSESFDIKHLKTQNISEYGRVISEPQSTDFTFSRFWVPYLNNYEGYSIFCDCDFLFLHDVSRIKFDPTVAVSVVQRPEYTPHSETKMGGISQHKSPRKNWSSLMIFNNSHPDCCALTPEYLNNVVPGNSLHMFTWTNSIGNLDAKWNTLDEYDDYDSPYAIHYTDGGPWFEDRMNTRYAKEWIKYYEDYCRTY